MLIDTIGCGLEGLRVDPQCRALMDPVVEVSSSALGHTYSQQRLTHFFLDLQGTVVPNGAKIPGTPYQLDPM